VPGGVRRREVDDKPNSGYRFIGDPSDAKAMDFYQSGKGRRRPHQQPIRVPFQMGAVIGNESREGQEPL
jgi:hypothetical protein